MQCRLGLGEQLWLRDGAHIALSRSQMRLGDLPPFMRRKSSVADRFTGQFNGRDDEVVRLGQWTVLGRCMRRGARVGAFSLLMQTGFIRRRNSVG